MGVSRAENKLAEACFKLKIGREFFGGKTVLDIGSSTGGFTEYAILAGARKVIAVEKGSRQMKAPLRFDPKVELHEKSDFFEFIVSEKIDVVVADVSFVSLRKILERAKSFSQTQEAKFLVMVKPQFEAKREELVGGVVKNEKIRRRILAEFEAWAKENGFLVRGKADNETRGKKGNLERFYFLERAEE